MPLRSVHFLCAVLTTLAPMAWMASPMAAETIETLIGTGIPGVGPGGNRPLDFGIDSPFGVIESPDGSIIFCDTGNHRVLALSPDGQVRVIAGTGSAGFSGNGGPAAAAALNEPYEVRLHSSGDLYIVERMNHVVRKVDARDNRITIVAGTGAPGYSGDGESALEARLNQPHSIAFSPDGNRLYLCDIGNHRVRVIDLESGRIETFAGTGTPGSVDDGDRYASADLAGPRCIVFDVKGDAWLSLREGRAIYRLDLKTERLHHVSGTGQKGFDGDGGPAKDAILSGPLGLALSTEDDRLYFCDTDNHVVRMIDLKSTPVVIRTIAGTGAPDDGEPGSPLDCGLARPHGITVTSDGRILIGDTNNHRIRAIVD